MRTDEMLKVQGIHDKLMDEIGFLRDLLRQHRCNADGLRTVGECVDNHYCGCSCGLYLHKGGEAGAGSGE